MIVLMRGAVLRLLKRDPTIGVLEITFFKITIAALILTPFPFIFEQQGFPELWDSSETVKLIVAAGVVLTMM